MQRVGYTAVVPMVALGIGAVHVQSEDQAAGIERSRALVPAPPWPDGDQRGMDNTHEVCLAVSADGGT